MVQTIYKQIDSNRMKAAILMLGFSVFIILVAYILVLALGYQGTGALSFVGIFLIISGLINLGSYYWSDKLVLNMSGAVSIEKKDNPELYRTVENLTIASGTPMPKIYLIDDQAPNAFATGRDPKHSAIAFTTGILNSLERLELEGVAAHELSHVKNYDTRLMSIVVILVGTVAILADLFFRSLWWGRGNDERRGGNVIIFVVGIVVAILAPIAASIIKFAISRRREFLADSSGALLTRNPEGLASALLKISSSTVSAKHANPATAHLFIINPLKGERAKSWLAGLFQTHPPVEERVEALRASIGATL
ncbi:MAG: M48 family metallopeptidase [bacterium]|nr:M48 family metallopeptidase [bacterium]